MGSEGMLRRCVFEGCIGTFDTEIERRPYHKNCSCALHHKAGNKCPRESLLNGSNKISYNIRRAWSESCLVAAASAGGSSHSSASSSPAVTHGGERVPVVGLCSKEGKVVWES